MKKITAFCMAFILSFCCLPVLSFASLVPDGYPTKLPYMIRNTSGFYYTQLSDDDIIEQVLKQKAVVSEIENGSDFTTSILTSDAIVYQCFFTVAFDDPSYVDGQTYSFSCEFSKNVDVAYFVAFDNVSSVDFVADAFDYTNETMDVGAVFSPNKYYDLPLSYLSQFGSPTNMVKGFETDTISLNFEILFGNYYSYENLYIDPDGNVTPDYNTPAKPWIWIPFYVIFRDNTDRTFSLNNITFAPTGTTKNLYSEEFFQNGLLDGFDNLEDQMSDVNENLDDIEDILNGEGETYEPLPEESFFNEYHEAESEYNKDFSDELDNLIGNADGIFDGVNGSSAFSFITSIFDDIIVSNSKINGLIMFCLSLGLCVLILGRRLNSG